LLTGNAESKLRLVFAAAEGEGCCECSAILPIARLRLGATKTGPIFYGLRFFMTFDVSIFMTFDVLTIK
jgi:hypothetical protein